MVNKAYDRLIAAGASPERARRFVSDFAKINQAKSQTNVPASKTARAIGGVRPMQTDTDTEDPYDKEIANVMQARYPTMFRPQSLTNEQKIDYIKGTYGVGQWNTIIRDISSRYGPTYAASLKQDKNKVIGDAANSFKNGTPLAVIIDKINVAGKTAGGGASGTGVRPDTIPANYLGGLSTEDAIKQVTRIYNEFKTVNNYTLNAATKFLENDPYYKLNLPHPNLQFASKTDLASGKISVSYHPDYQIAVTNKYKQFDELFKANPGYLSGIVMPPGYYNIKPGTLASAARQADITGGAAYVVPGTPANAPTPRITGPRQQRLQVVKQEAIDESLANEVMNMGYTPYWVDSTIRETLKGKSALGS